MLLICQDFLQGKIVMSLLLSKDFNTFTGRAIADLHQGFMNDQPELLKTLKIVVLSDNTVKSFPINETFSALTQSTVYDITKQTKVVIHGFKDNSQSALPQELGHAYNDKKLFNVLLLDAEALLNEGYIKCVHNARLIGKRLANLLANLEEFGANAEDLHLIGISLGAHIAGWAGKYFWQFKKLRLGRVTGLDPAGPCFSYAYSDQRLDKTDASYVDVIHSNRLVQGVVEPLGHADFYLNGGGPTQPGCVMPTCCHLRAAEVYIQSIKTPKSFVGVRCKSWKHFMANACDKDDYAVLGYGSSTTTRGQFYLRTTGNSPFGLGMQGTVRSKMGDWLMKLNLTR